MYLSSSYSGGRGGGEVRRLAVVDNDFDHVVRFNSADFDLCDRVSVGLAGKVLSLSLTHKSHVTHRLLSHYMSVLFILFFRPTR